MTRARLSLASSTRGPLVWMRHACLAIAGLGLIAAPTHASPEGAQVAAGSAHIAQPDATTTIIEAANNTVIDFQSFNIGAGEMVRFIQPSETSRVLNRVLGPGATQIDGSLLANGHVYIANRYGVFFGSQAVVNVGQITAVAGSISNADFLGGIDRFTELQGTIHNDGRIEANAARLIGQRVANYGSIVAKDGLVTMLAGDEILLTDGKSPVLVKVSADTDPNTPAIINQGTVDTGTSGSALFGAADTYALAIRHSGQVKGQNVKFDGGDGQVQVTGGLIDATNDTGSGGVISLVGGDVVVAGDAVVDASGATGGGQVFVGGNLRGQGPLPNATHTYVGPNAKLKANATEQGDGGTVIVWSDYATWFFGTASARGGDSGGDGGLAEVSGKFSLTQDGAYDLYAPRGKGGTLLFDPLEVVIVGGLGDGGDDNANQNSFVEEEELVVEGENGFGAIEFGDYTVNTVFTVYESEIEGEFVTPGGNIIIEAGRSITAVGGFRDGNADGRADLLVDNNFIPNPARPDNNDIGLELRTRNSVADGAGGIDLTTSANGNDLVIQTHGTGEIIIQASTAAQATGDIALPALETEGGDITVQTSASDITIEGPVTSNGGDVNITAGGTMGSITLNGALSATTGAVNIQANLDVTFGADGDLTTTTGNVNIDADADANSTGMITMDPDTEINSGSGTLDLDAAGDIFLGSLTTTNTAVVSITSSTGGIIDNNDDALTMTTNVNVTAPNVSFAAVDQIGTVTDLNTGSGDAIEVLAGTALTGAATTAANSTINIDLTGSTGNLTGTLDPGGANDGSAVITTPGNIDASAGLGAIFVAMGTDNFGVFSGGTLTLPDGGLNLPGARVWLGGDTDIIEAGATPRDINFVATAVNFESGAAGGNTTLNTTVPTLSVALAGAANLTVMETGPLTLNNATTADGSIAVTSAGDLTATNVDSSATNDGSNPITLSSTGGNVQVVSVNAGSANDVTLNAATGMITDTGNTVVGDDLVATSATGIQLNTTVNTADLSVTGTGDITVVETNDINLLDVDTADGMISVNAGGLITATDVDSSATDDDTNDISLTAGSGGLVVASVNAGAMNDVTLNSGGPIADTGVGIVGDVLMVTAAGDTTLDTQVTSVDAMTSAGFLTINETDDLTVTNAITTNGPVTLTISAGNMSVMTITAGGNQTVTFSVLGSVTGAMSMVTGGLLDLFALNDIQLNTNIDMLQSSSNGNVTIVETDGITLGTSSVKSVATTSGFIDVDAGGTITATAVDTINNGEAFDIMLDTTSGDIIVGSVVAGSFNPGAPNDVFLTTTDPAGRILAANPPDGVADVSGEDVTLAAGMGIGTISDFETNSGNPLEITVEGTLRGASTTAAGSAINLKLIGGTPMFTAGGIDPGTGVIGSAIIQSDADLDVSGGLGAFLVDAGDSIGLVSDMTLTIPDGGFNLGAGNGLFIGTTDIVDAGASPRDITLTANTLTFQSGAAGGDTHLDVTANRLRANLTGGPADFSAMALGNIELVDVTTADGSIFVSGNGTVTATNVDSSAVDDGTNTITISSVIGNLLYDTINAGSMNDVLLVANAGSINPVGSLITADVLTATSSTGADLITMVNSVTANTNGTGDITITEADALLVTQVTTNNGDISITVLNSPMTITQVNAGAGDVALNSPTTIDNSDALNNLANVTGGNLSINAAQIGMATPLEVDATTQLSAQGNYIDIRQVGAGPLVIGNIGERNTGFVNLTSNATIMGQSTDFLPDLWGHNVFLTAGLDGLTPTNNDSIGTMLLPLEVIATGSFNADTSATPMPFGNAYIRFIGENKGGVINVGNFVFDTTMLSNISEALGANPSLGGGILVGNSFITAEDLAAMETEHFDAHEKPLGAGPSSPVFVPRRPDEFASLGGLKPVDFRSVFNRRVASFMRTRAGLDPKPTFDARSFLAFLGIAADDDAVGEAQAESKVVLDGLKQIVARFDENGLFEEDHDADRRRTLGAVLPGVVSPADLDEMVNLLQQIKPMPPVGIVDAGE